MHNNLILFYNDICDYSSFARTIRRKLVTPAFQCIGRVNSIALKQIDYLVILVFSLINCLLHWSTLHRIHPRRSDWSSFETNFRNSKLVAKRSINLEHSIKGNYNLKPFKYSLVILSF